MREDLGHVFSLKDIRAQLVADINQGEEEYGLRDATMLPISKDEIHRAFAKPGCCLTDVRQI